MSAQVGGVSAQVVGVSAQVVGVSAQVVAFCSSLVSGGLRPPSAEPTVRGLGVGGARASVEPSLGEPPVWPAGGAAVCVLAMAADGRIVVGTRDERALFW